MGEITNPVPVDSEISNGEISLRPGRNPYYVYLARLSAGSRPTMADALRQIARIASGGRLEPDRFPWHLLRYPHVQAIRTALVETVSSRLFSGV